MGMMSEVTITMKAAAIVNDVTVMARTGRRYAQPSRSVIGVYSVNATAAFFQSSVMTNTSSAPFSGM